MSIPNWPSIKAPDYNRYRESLIKPARRTEFEGNTISTRPRAGKVRQRFTVGWSKLSDADKETLFTFFSNYQGLHSTSRHRVNQPLSCASLLPMRSRPQQCHAMLQAGQDGLCRLTCTNAKIQQSLQMPQRK